MSWSGTALVLVLVLSLASLLTNLNTWLTLREPPFIHTEVAQVEQVAKTTWVDTDNNKHTVETVRGDSETAAAWAARHQEAVEAMQELYPPA